MSLVDPGTAATEVMLFKLEIGPSDTLLAGAVDVRHYMLDPYD